MRYPGGIDTSLVDIDLSGNETATALVDRVFPGSLGKRIRPQ